jgi:hypothetical protein
MPLRRQRMAQPQRRRRHHERSLLSTGVQLLLLLLEEEEEEEPLQLVVMAKHNLQLVVEPLKDDVAKSNRQPFRDTMEVVSLKMTISAA